MKPNKLKNLVVLASVLVCAGCAYLCPEPGRLAGGTISQDHDTVVTEAKTDSEDAGVLGFLERSAFNIFQEVGR